MVQSQRNGQVQQFPRSQSPGQMAEDFTDILARLVAVAEIDESEDDVVLRQTFPGFKIRKEILNKRDEAVKKFLGDEFGPALELIKDAMEHFEQSRGCYARKTLVTVFEDRLSKAKDAGALLEEIGP